VWGAIPELDCALAPMDSLSGLAVRGMKFFRWNGDPHKSFRAVGRATQDEEKAAVWK
jgi:hypothetical protein